jgi:hypothetical protein
MNLDETQQLPLEDGDNSAQKISGSIVKTNKLKKSEDISETIIAESETVPIEDSFSKDQLNTFTRHSHEVFIYFLLLSFFFFSLLLILKL